MTLVLCLVLALLPTAAFAADDRQRRRCVRHLRAEGDGSNLTWTLTADGALTISGTGDMMSQFNQVEPVWGRYVRTARIASGVTTIGAGGVPPLRVSHERGAARYADCDRRRRLQRVQEFVRADDPGGASPPSREARLPTAAIS